MSRSLLTFLLVVLFSAATLAEEADPPVRVARLSLIQGLVTFQASGDGAPEEAELNRPLTWGDRLLTEGESRAEVSVGTAAIRLDHSTDLSIANLDEDIVQLELNSGTLGIHLRELGDAETFEIDTPNAVVLLREPGDYRIEVDSQNATVVAVRTGEAELDGGAGAIRLGERQELRFTGVEQAAAVRSLGLLTAFDEWCIEREQTLADRESTRYVSREVVGYEDLDRYGSWSSEPGYGYVWAPSYVSIGWAPYRFGHWSWVGPWGFTWVDHAPWGYAPFHYGRWAYLRHRWCWVPGPRHIRPVWAPALVGWHGMSGVRDPSPGSVSWFPLGPRDIYVPTHRATPRYVRAVNISNASIDNHGRITNAWRGRLREPPHANRDAPGAMSALPADAFSRDRVQPGRVMRVYPTGESAPQLTSQPVAARDNAWREAFNARRAEVAREPQARPEIGQRAVDPRRSIPHPPPNKRVIHSTNDSGTQVDPSKFGRREQPPKNLSDLRRATPADSGQQARTQRDSRQFTRDTGSGARRGDRSGALHAGGRAERDMSGGRADSGRSGARAQSNRGGESHVSGSHASSGRGGGHLSGRGGGEARASGSSSSRSGRGGGLSARP